MGENGFPSPKRWSFAASRLTITYRAAEVILGLDRRCAMVAICRVGRVRRTTAGHVHWRGSLRNCSGWRSCRLRRSGPMPPVRSWTDLRPPGGRTPPAGRGRWSAAACSERAGSSSVLRIRGRRPVPCARTHRSRDRSSPARRSARPAPVVCGPWAERHARVAFPTTRTRRSARRPAERSPAQPPGTIACTKYHRIPHTTQGLIGHEPRISMVYEVDYGLFRRPRRELTRPRFQSEAYRTPTTQITSNIIRTHRCPIPALSARIAQPKAPTSKNHPANPLRLPPPSTSPPTAMMLPHEMPFVSRPRQAALACRKALPVIVAIVVVTADRTSIGKASGMLQHVALSPACCSTRETGRLASPRTAVAG